MWLAEQPGQLEGVMAEGIGRLAIRRGTMLGTTVLCCFQTMLLAVRRLKGAVRIHAAHGDDDSPPMATARP